MTAGEIPEVIGMSKESTKKPAASPERVQAGLQMMEMAVEVLGQRALAKFEADLNSDDDRRQFRAAKTLLPMFGKWQTELLRAKAYALAVKGRQGTRPRDGRRAQEKDGPPVEIGFAGEED